MSEFMENHIIDYKHRRLDEPPVKIHVVVYRAGTPPVAILDDPSGSETYAEVASMLVNAAEDFLLGSRHVPLPQDFVAPKGRGHKKELVELNFAAYRLGYFDAIAVPRRN
jgi:hypothetical protein